MIEIVDRLRTGMEQTPGVVHDDSGEEPDTYEPEHVYAFPVRDATLPADGLQTRTEFGIRIVYVADNEGEEAIAERDPDVTLALSDKRDAYLEWIREHAATDLWDHVDADADADFVRNFDGRAVAVLVSGFRFDP